MVFVSMAPHFFEITIGLICIVPVLALLGARYPRQLQVLAVKFQRLQGVLLKLIASLVLQTVLPGPIVLFVRIVQGRSRLQGVGAIKL